MAALTSELQDSNKIKGTMLDYIKDSLQGKAVYAGEVMYIASRNEMDGILDNIAADIDVNALEPTRREVQKTLRDIERESIRRGRFVLRFG